jgi:DNA-binding MarR family transcriptional regulator
MSASVMLNPPAEPNLWPAGLVKALRDGGLLEGRELSVRQVATLAVSALPPPKLREVRVIAETLGAPRSAISRAADVLEALDLVRREVDRHDRRIVRLTVTLAGEAKLRSLRIAFDTLAKGTPR